MCIRVEEAVIEGEVLTACTRNCDNFGRGVNTFQKYLVIIDLIIAEILCVCVCVCVYVCVCVCVTDFNKTFTKIMQLGWQQKRRIS